MSTRSAWAFLCALVLLLSAGCGTGADSGGQQASPQHTYVQAMDKARKALFKGTLTYDDASRLRFRAGQQKRTVDLKTQAAAAPRSFFAALWDQLKTGWGAFIGFTSGVGAIWGTWSLIAGAVRRLRRARRTAGDSGNSGTLSGAEPDDAPPPPPIPPQLDEPSGTQ